MLFGGAFDGIKFMDIAMILLLAAGIFLIFRMLRKPQPQQQRPEPMQYAGVGTEPRAEPSLPPAQPTSSAAPTQPAANYFPAGFDADSFARNAKQQFVRLQEAHDRGDLSALREFLTTTMYKEIEAQVRERGGATQKTEVVTLESRVVEVVTEGDHYIASVRFTGMMKDDPASQPEHFSEVWHLQKPLNGSTGWQLCGIQQD
jgi:predicted lipid-binding transport protein (Tim44 family)